MGLPSFTKLKNRLAARLIARKLAASTEPRGRQALICIPTSPGSLGDEAMIQATVTALVERGLSVDLLVMSQDEDWSAIEGVRHKQIISTSESDLRTTIKSLSSYREFYLIGADVLDGYHDEPTTIRLLWLTWLASLVCKSTIIGFSFNNSPTRNSVAMLRRLPKTVTIFARDSISKQRLANLAQIDAILSADIAFLLDPSLHAESSKPYLRWIKKQKQNGRSVIGVNISGHSFQNVDQVSTRSKIITHYKSELEALLQQNMSVVLIPHDIRGENGDLMMLQDLYKSIDVLLLDHVVLMEQPLYAASIKNIVGSLDAVISGRMHLAIACLGMSTPVACVVYQGKFEGLYRHFPDITVATISPENVLQPTAIISLVTTLLSRRHATSRSIKERLPYIQKLALKNIKHRR